MIRVGQERYRDALRQGVAATELARQAGDREALAQALVAAASAELFLGSGGTERMKEALRVYEQLGDLSKVAMARGNIGACAFIEGRWDEALSWLERARDAELRAGNHVGAATADANRGEIFAKQGRVHEAEPILREAVRIMRAAGFNDGAAYTEIQLGRALLGLGATREADELLERVGTELARYGRKSSVLEATIVRSIARLRLGDGPGALELLDEATATAADPIDLLEPQLADARALTLVALGRDADAQEQLARGLAAARKHGLSYEEGMLLRRRASLCAARGGTPDGEDVRRASEILGALGVRKRPSAP
jgi:tetratricopeptide (TPR) repeat protein